MKSKKSSIFIITESLVGGNKIAEAKSLESAFDMLKNWNICESVFDYRMMKGGKKPACLIIVGDIIKK